MVMMVTDTLSRDRLERRAAVRRAGLYHCAHAPVFADAYEISIHATVAPTGQWEGEILMQAEAGYTSGARQHFNVTGPGQTWGTGPFLRWRHHIGRPGHGLWLTFIEETSS
jgi:hypothetical protein